MFSCFGTPNKRHSDRKRLEKTDKDRDGVARVSTRMGNSRQEDLAEDNDRAPCEENEAPLTRKPSTVSQENQPPTRTSHGELKDVKDRLFNWLTANNVDVDPLQTTATSMLSGVFASHDSLWKLANRLEDRVTRRDTKLRNYEIEKTAAEQHISRLMQTLETEKNAAEREIFRLGQIIERYESDLTSERAEKERLVTAHGQEVANLDIKHRELGEQHKTFVNDLIADHDSLVHQKLKEHQDAVNRLEIQHRDDIWVERQKVIQAEEDMRMSVDHFQALQDDELKNRFYKLRTDIESLSRLSPTTDFMQQAHAMGVNFRLPANIPRRDHKLLLQGVLWAIVVEGLFHTPFRVFGAYGDPIYQTWTALFGHNQNGLLDWPEAEPLVEKWRYTTVDRLKRVLSSTSVSHGQDRQIQSSYRNNISNLASKLTSLFSSPASDTNTQGLSTRLQDILNQASTFALLISLERCRVRVFLPSTLGPHIQRDSKDIKDVYPGNEAEMPYATAEFVVAPGLSKEGNSRGGKLEERTVLSKAGVYFSLERNAGLS